ncbi:MAG: S9 family peptidase [Saprospiraceae bacterium]|nr:S9 family peptidase [Saprospiraceae bacterium]
MKTNLTLLFAIMAIASTLCGQAPSFEEVISLQSVYGPSISPDGKHVLFSRSSTDWEENRFDREIWISQNGDRPFPLTNTPDGNSFDAKWSPDGKWIAFRAARAEKTQLYLIRPNGGEAMQLTHSERSIGGYEWSPDGSRIAYAQSIDDNEDKKKRSKKYGEFAVEDQEFSLSELWIMEVDFDRLGHQPLPAERNDSSYQERLKPHRCKHAPYSIEGFYWSPDGTQIAFSHQPDPLINSFFKAGISIYDLGQDTSSLLIDHPSSDFLMAWSPSGDEILYASAMDDTTSNYYTNNRSFIINLSTRVSREIGTNLDEDLGSLTWTKAGILGTAWQKTTRNLYRVDPVNGMVTEIPTPLRLFYSYSVSKDGTRMAYSGRQEQTLSEIYLADFPLDNSKQITQVQQQLQDWEVGTSEVVQWSSKDGATIEGILHKPENYDPGRQYPLMVVIHGGPTGISTPEPVPAYVYPQVQWLDKGALVLRPNYRGSAGYGADFRALNVRNLGVGDAWDVESGVQHLIDQGMVHPDSVASMGWSQGGYISAFLATNSTMFKAISVGAGISNWMTYYVNTDIHPFTRQYLQATPWSDKQIYEKTSPMTNINDATTPTLIQHGEFDRRVPVPNAYELFQGLQDVGVPTELIIYKGFGHGITKPKERLAAMWHNWIWVGKHVWGEQLTLPE